MLKNDPFKTREEAIKTILAGTFNPDNVKTHTLEKYMMFLNDCFNERIIKKYFMSLYKKFPNDFKIESMDFYDLPNDSRYSLYFMNQLITQMVFCKDVKTVDDFFENWLIYIDIIEPESEQNNEE